MEEESTGRTNHYGTSHQRVDLRAGRGSQVDLFFVEGQRQQLIQLVSMPDTSCPLEGGHFLDDWVAKHLDVHGILDPVDLLQAPVGRHLVNLIHGYILYYKFSGTDVLDGLYELIQCLCESILLMLAFSNVHLMFW